MPSGAAGRSVAGRILRQSAQIDRSGVELWFGLRCTIGVAIPLVASLLLHRPADGVAVSIGAIVVGFASRQGVYRTRAATMLLASAAMGVATFVGSASGGGSPVLHVAVTVLWALAVGILASLGASATAIGLNSVLAITIFGQFHFTPLEAAEQGLYVFAGGVLQTVLLVIVWPFQRFSAERSVLAKAYRSLGAYASNIPRVKLAPPDPTTFTSVHDTLEDPQPFARRGEVAAFRALLLEAERIRATLAALAVDRYLLETAGARDASDDVRELGSAAHDIVIEIAGALDEARAPHEREGLWPALDARMAAIERKTAADPAIAAGQTVGDAHALLGQLRAAWRAACLPAGAFRKDKSAGAALGPMVSYSPFIAREALATLRANCSPGSPFAQHAVRLAATLGVADVLANVLPLQRGYWIALTAALVLRPDFATTFVRGVARIAGTLAGALLASSIAATLHPGPVGLLVGALIFAAIGYTIFSVNYAIYTVTITGYVVFLLAFGGLPEHSAILDRVIATLLGGALALTAYFVWPTWERERVAAQLADLLDAQRAHMRLVLEAYANPAQAGEREIHRTQLAAWLARSNAEASADRMLNEPVHSYALGVRQALGILAASRRVGLAVLALQSRLPRSSVAPNEAFDTLVRELDRGLAIVASALRAAGPLQPLPPLREMQIALRRLLDDEHNAGVAALVSETDLLVDSINAMAHVLEKR